MNEEREEMREQIEDPNSGATVLIAEGDIPESGEEKESTEEILRLYRTISTRPVEGTIIKGRVLEVRPDEVIVDIGFKSEGIIPREELSGELAPGDEIEVYLESLEDPDGQVVLSKKKADFMRVWENLREAYEKKTPVRGKILRRIKGGFMVDVMGVEAFLPGSQVSFGRVTDFDSYVNQELDFRILMMNRARKNVVVSRKAVLEEERARQRETILSEIQVGQVREGVVKNITNFGAFLDLGGLDGLLHITDISWTKINHPSEVLKIGEKIKVKILDFDRENERVTVGLKQLVPSPWEQVTSQIVVGGKIKGKVTRVKSYGAFVDLGMGVEGLIHSSQFSWTNPNVDPTKIVRVGDEIEAVVLGIDQERKRISLGVKQLTPDPWETIEERYPINSIKTGKVKNMTSFGVFVELEEGIEGLIHISDLSWTKRILHPSEVLKKGQTINVVVLKIDKENRRISLGLKQLEKDPWPELAKMYSVGNETEGKIIRIMDKGVIVELPGGAEGFVPLAQLGKKVVKASDAFSIGDILPLKVIEFDRIDRRIVLSVSAYFESKEKEYLEKYLAQHPTKAFLVEELAQKPVIETIKGVSPEETQSAQEEATGESSSASEEASFAPEPQEKKDEPEQK